MNEPLAYGQSDMSFQTAGGEAGIRRLVDRFYDLMEARSDTVRIRDMHPDDLTVSRDKLTLFLCGWLGGPRLYNKKYGGISIPGVHAHLDIGSTERDAWLACMTAAVDEQPWDPAFKRYLMDQLAVPAERIREVIARMKQQQSEQE